MGVVVFAHMLTRWRQHYLLPLCAVTISVVVIRSAVTIDCHRLLLLLLLLPPRLMSRFVVSCRIQNIRTESSVKIFCRQLVAKSHSQLIAAVVAAAIGCCHFATFANVALSIRGSSNSSSLSTCISSVCCSSCCC